MLPALFVAAALSQNPAPRHEISVGPAVEWTAKFTHHEGTDLQYAYTIAPGLKAFGRWRENWSSGTTRFTQELVEVVREEPQMSTQTLLRRAFVVGLSMEPVHIELRSGGSVVGFVSAGPGAAHTQLDLSTASTPNSYVEVGARLTGFGEVGISWLATDRVSLALVADEMFFASHVETLNGCLYLSPSGSEVCDSDTLPEPRAHYLSSILRGHETDIRNIGSVAVRLAVRF